MILSRFGFCPACVARLRPFFVAGRYQKTTSYFLSRILITRRTSPDHIQWSSIISIRWLDLLKFQTQAVFVEKPPLENAFSNSYFILIFVNIAIDWQQAEYPR